MPRFVKIRFYSGWWIPLGNNKFKAENGAIWDIPNAVITQESAC